MIQINEKFPSFVLQGVDGNNNLTTVDSFTY